MSDNEIHKSLRDLGIEPGATWDDVGARYKLLVRMWHSDRARPEDKAIADQELKKINNARDLLKGHYLSTAHVAEGYCRCRALPDAPLQQAQATEAAATPTAHPESQSAAQSPPPPQPSAADKPPHWQGQSPVRAGDKSAVLFGIDFSNPTIAWIGVGLAVVALVCTFGHNTPDSSKSPGPYQVTATPQAPLHSEPPPQDPRLLQNQAEIDKRMTAADSRARAARALVDGYRQSMQALVDKINTDYGAGRETAADKQRLNEMQTKSSAAAGEAVRLEQLVKEIGKLRADDPQLSFERVDNEIARPVDSNVPVGPPAQAN